MLENSLVETIKSLPQILNKGYPGIYICNYAPLWQSRLTTKDYRNSRYEW
jgi:hypothetical protein